MGPQTVYRGGCLCGAFRYEARGAPRIAGHCYCSDCRKASGSGYIGFISFEPAAVTMEGETRVYSSPAANGGQADRNFCARCGSLVFGGRRDVEEPRNIYAGSLDDPTQFEPRIAIFTRGRPTWAALPETLIAFEGMPVRDSASA